MRRNVVNLLLMILMSSAFGCAHATAPAVTPSGTGEASVEALVDEFLLALGSHDEARLRDLALTYEEFETIVWPELPASHPGTNMTPEFVWNNYDMRSRVHFDRLLDRFGGRELQLESIRFGEPRPYKNFLIHDDPVLVLTAEDGSTEEHLLFGAIIEHDNRFKIYGYSTD